MPKKTNPDLEKSVLEIADTSKNGYKEIAALAGCSTATVCRILKKYYKNVNGNYPSTK